MTNEQKIDAIAVAHQRLLCLSNYPCLPRPTLPNTLTLEAR